MTRGRDAAEALDRADALAGWRSRFAIGDDEPIYLDGNSLGRLPKATADRLRQVVEDEWGVRLIRSWADGWMDLPVAVGDRIAALLGAAPGQVTVADSTTVCFYKLAVAALDARPGRSEIVTDRANFPTDRYVLEGLASQRGLTIRWIDADPAAGPTPAEVAAVTGPGTALVSFTHVAYRSAYVLDMAAIDAVAHAAGALTLWDLSHSAGAVRLALDDDGADLAVGCTYKYLSGGPGSPAYLYVREELQRKARQPIWGWLGRRDPFAMEPGYEPAGGIWASLSGTPPVLGLAAVDEGVALVAAAGIERIEAKGRELGSLAIELADGWLTPHGVTVGSPREAARRGAHVALVHPAAREICDELAAAGVIVDFRTPNAIRLGLSPLTTRFVDVWDALAVLRTILGRR